MALVSALKTNPATGVLDGVGYRLEVPDQIRQPKPNIYSVIARGLDQWTTDADIKAELEAAGYGGLEEVSRFTKGGLPMPLCRISFNNAESARLLLSSGLRIGIPF